MATRISKPLTRETMTAITKGKHRGRTLMVQLCPGDVLVFWPKGTQHRTVVPLKHCHVLAEILEAGHEYREKMQRYKDRKAAGLKGLRKPKRPTLFFSSFYMRSL